MGKWGGGGRGVTARLAAPAPVPGARHRTRLLVRGSLPVSALSLRLPALRRKDEYPHLADVETETQSSETAYSGLELAVTGQKLSPGLPGPQAQGHKPSIPVLPDNLSIQRGPAFPTALFRSLLPLVSVWHHHCPEQ